MAVQVAEAVARTQARTAEAVPPDAKRRTRSVRQSTTRRAPRSSTTRRRLHQPPLLAPRARFLRGSGLSLPRPVDHLARDLERLVPRRPNQSPSSLSIPPPRSSPLLRRFPSARRHQSSTLHIRRFTPRPRRWEEGQGSLSPLEAPRFRRPADRHNSSISRARRVVDRLGRATSTLAVEEVVAPLP